MRPQYKKSNYNNNRFIEDNERVLFFNFFNNKKKIALISHVDPDGDAIASIFSIYFICELKSICSEIFLFNELPFTEYNKWNLQILSLSKFDPQNYDGVIFVDTSSFSRSGLNEKFVLTKPSLCIDHHIDNQFFCDYNIVAPLFCSTTEIIYDLINNTKLFNSFINSYENLSNNKLSETSSSDLKKNLLNNLYESILMGILFDTYYLNTENVDYIVLKRVSDLQEKTDSIHKLKNLLFKNQSPIIYKFWGYVLSNISLYFNDMLVIARADKSIFSEFEKEYKNFNPTIATEGFINHLMSLRNVCLAIFIREIQDEVKVSIRSSIKVASVLANKFGGGGHPNAAAFKIKREDNFDINKLERQILDIIEKEGFFNI